MHVTATEIPK